MGVYAYQLIPEFQSTSSSIRERNNLMLESLLPLGCFNPLPLQ
ncbi:hypothetical protein LEP1GSC081_4458 [Leptospira kirschneri str. H1]|uniref:Uncharacterized protein n=1 Tax=Leptospira kirschneri str. H1 TaxID=1049966 RepID=A0A0E2B1N7_9LEPT|nr:hypothetical protein LEP1GSC081_4458 [Leptospira kirschneri str. H1]